MLLQSIFYGVLAIALVFGACKIGQRLSNTFNEINVAFCQLQWYLYPLEIQQTLVPTLIYVQQPVVIEFFGSISCSAEQFKKVRCNVIPMNYHC